ncbi:MAG: hypothetical protein WA419_22565 [Silvibacterium sp.]
MMLRRFLITAAAIALSAAGVFAAYQVNEAHAPELAAMMPSGALLYIESPDFHSLLADWSQSSEKQAWLEGDDYAVFSRSRLFGRLAQAQTEFADAAGVPSNMQLLDQIAGKQSAFAWYDIGKLEFLYITHLPSSSFEQSTLWQSRGKFEQRQSGKANFYVRTDPESKRTVAFAVAGDWVILGTREDLVAGTLALLSGSQSETLHDEAWYADSIKAAKTPGDLRMVLNLEKIVPSPYFRSYWIQQNITEMKQYRAAISDLYRTSAAYREERVLLRREQASGAAAVSDVSALAAAVPASAGFYKAWAAPDAAQATAIVRDKLLDPRPAVATDSQYAPSATVMEQNAGNAADFETRIDQAPVVARENVWAQLRPAIEASQVKGLLEVDTSYSQRDGAFSGVHSAVVLSALHGWDAKQIRKLIADGLNAQTSASHFGVGWVEKGDFLQLDGLLPLYLAVQGNTLILANDADLLEALGAKLREKPVADQGEMYISKFNHAQESPAFLRTSTLIDRANMRGRQDGAAEYDVGQRPAFFSGNIASLSRMFSGVASGSIIERDAGINVVQTVIYQWR